jgi:hypothetical protein
MNSFASSDFDAEWEALINGTDIAAPQELNLPNAEKKDKEKLYEGDTVVSNSEEEQEDSQDEKSDSEGNEVQDNAEILAAVSSTFNTLILQVDELRAKYLKESETRKKMEILNKKMLVQLTSVMEENAEMQEALKNKVEARRGSITAPSGGNRRNKRMTQIETANNPEQNLQLALMQGEDEDFMVGFDDGVKAKNNFFNKMSMTINSMLPFEKDVRVIQASFGGAVAAYFKFFRWMYVFCVLLLRKCI